jgi:hypothetical protein
VRTSKPGMQSPRPRLFVSLRTSGRRSGLGALTHKRGGNRALPLAVGGGCRFNDELARLQAGRSQGQLQYLDANHLVVGVLREPFDPAPS